MNGYCLFYIEEEYIKFCFCYRCKEIIDASGVYMDRTVDMWSVR